MKKLLVPLCIASFLGSSALAIDDSGLFLEPAVTYELGKTSVDYPSPINNSTGTAEGLGLGLRLGFHLDQTFFLALDGRYSIPDFKDSSVNYNAKSVSTNWGPTVGLQMPNWGMRFWLAYIAGGEINPEASNGLDVKFSEAKGFRLGTGFHYQMFSINLEYQELKYADTTIEAIGSFTPGTSFNNVELENKTWVASLSFPFAFLQ